MQNEQLEAREGQGIKLLINPNSNYGLTNYKPIKDKNDSRYKKAELMKKWLEEAKEFTFKGADDRIYHFNYEEAKKYIKCKTCAAERTNNFERYCRKCPNYPHYTIIEEDNNAK